MAKGFKHGAGGGGASLNFKVVGGTTEPASPKENTIWVNTDAEITSWAFSAAQPENPSEGMAWISTTTSSPTKFNALKKNSIQVYPLSAKQYASGAWVDKEAKIYQDGAWVDWLMYLYNMGDECKALTGGWQARAWRANNSSSTTGEPTITKGTDSMVIKFASGSGVAEVVKDINFSGRKTLYCNIESIVGGDDPYYTALIAIVPRNATYYSDNAVAESMLTETGVISLNIGNLDAGASYDVVIGGRAKSGQTYSVTVDKIWCE
jgi:hypothetical protein